MPPKWKDFGEFIGWIAEKYHDGTVSAISDRIGCSVATANFWRRHRSLPDLEHMERLAEAYNVPFPVIRELVRRAKEDRRRRPVPIRGGSRAQKPLPVDESSALQAPPHQGSAKYVKDETLC